MKKPLSLVVMLMLLLQLMCGAVLAEDDEQSERLGNWYYDNTATVFGPQMEDSWQTYAVVDLTIQGEQTFAMVGAGAWLLGGVTVNVDGDTVTVDYCMLEDADKYDVWNEINVDAEYLNIFADAAAIDTEAESTFAFGEPISIANDLNGDTIVCLYVRNQVDFADDNPYVIRFWSNMEEIREIAEAMEALLEQ